MIQTDSPPRRESRLMLGFVGWVAALAILALALVVWSSEAARPEYKSFVATPEAAFAALTKLIDNAAFWRAVGGTLGTWSVGFAIAAAAGLVVGALAGRTPQLASIFGPSLLIAGALPVAILALLAILYDGINSDAGGRLAAAVLGFAAIAAITAYAQRAADRSDRAAGTLRALEVGAVIALAGVVFAEVIVGQQRLGALALQASTTFDTPTLYALILAVWILGFVLALPFAIARWLVGLAR